MAEEFGSGTRDLMIFFTRHRGKRVWFLTASGVVSGTLDGTPDDTSKVLKLRNATIYAPGKKQKSAKEVVLLVRQIFSWGEGTPDFAASDK